MEGVGDGVLWKSLDTVKGMRNSSINHCYSVAIMGSIQ